MKYFGTDGIRGVANEFLSPEIAFKVGRFIGNNQSTKRKIVVGKDSRISGDMLEAALVSGITSAGGDVLLLGVVSTPAVTYLTTQLGADFGVIISASHNPVIDNGIKIVDYRGLKISEDMESKIEKFIEGEDNIVRATAGIIGKVYDSSKEVEQYIEKTTKTINSNLKGMNIVVDCANGATSYISKLIFEKFMCNVTFISNSPNGLNINDECGSTHLKNIKQSVIENKADLGIAFDGDGDRVLFVDENGVEADGDILVYLLTQKLKSTNTLPNDKVALTVMSNLGTIKALKNSGIDVITTPVGDKYVSQALESEGLILGGETSGHIILKEFSQGGDGLLVALHVLEYLYKESIKLSQAIKAINKYPSILTNVNVLDKNYAINHRSLIEEITRIENILGDSGRVLVRASGTENKVRVLVECEDVVDCRDYSASLVDTLKNFKEN